MLWYKEEAYEWRKIGVQSPENMRLVLRHMAGTVAKFQVRSRYYHIADNMSDNYPIFIAITNHPHLQCPLIRSCLYFLLSPLHKQYWVNFRCQNTWRKQQTQTTPPTKIEQDDGHSRSMNFGQILTTTKWTFWLSIFCEMASKIMHHVNCVTERNAKMAQLEFYK